MNSSEPERCFFDACNSDGYLYELDCDGHVLCRNRSTSDWIDGEPPESIDIAWLRILTNPAFDKSDVHVVLGVLDSDGVWYKSGDYKGESTMDAVLPGTITHWMPYAMPPNNALTGAEGVRIEGTVMRRGDKHG